MNRKPIINVTDARRLLGVSAADLSDEEVQRVVGELDDLAGVAIDSYVVLNHDIAVDGKAKSRQNGSK